TIIVDPHDGGQRTFRRITPQPFRNCKAHYLHVLRFLMGFVPARSEMRQGGAPQPPVGEHSRYLVRCET
ncbi:MAG TPA: hypothetical protein VF788_10120, partial [Pseudonocardiaceae bacterium]